VAAARVSAAELERQERLRFADGCFADGLAGEACNARGIKSTFRDENPHWKPATSGTQFFHFLNHEFFNVKKIKKRSETRFGSLLMSSGRLVLFSGESELFVFVENVR